MRPTRSDHGHRALPKALCSSRSSIGSSSTRTNDCSNRLVVLPSR